MKTFKYLLLALVVVGLLAAGAASYKLYRGNAFIWLPDYVTGTPDAPQVDGPTDIIFVVVDHWEPGGHAEVVNRWMTDYRAIAEKHRDFHGVNLKHTWYYPIESFRGWEVDSLVKLCRLGLGDVEVHLHHFDDSSLSLRRLLSDGLDSLQAHNALISLDGVTRFSFIHGNWALDNSGAPRGSRVPCGVNDEISILLEYGCYSDCTFPAMGETSQPSLVNKIFYAVDDPEEPKSHDTGTLSEVGLVTTPDQLQLFVGPYMIDWKDWRFKTHPTFDDGNLYWEIPSTLHRFEVWLKANIHVKGRPNWVFVRPFTHGADIRRGGDRNILGENFDQMLTDIEKNYNDGENYRLHYMTAREAFNVIKAAEAGLDGNPHDYRDFVLKPYVYPAGTNLDDSLVISQQAGRESSSLLTTDVP